MLISLHKQATTTPKIRAAIQASDEPAWLVAERYGISEQTVWKWRKRDSVLDRSHTAHRLQTTLTPAQEAVAVVLRQALLLPLDDLLSVVREFLNPNASRSGLDRCLRRHGVGNLRELTIREALTLFCEREIARKDQRRIEMSFGLARFPFSRDLAGFDFAAQPSIDRGQIRDLATGRFVANGEAVLLLGPPGVGKTHLAVAIGREVIVAGYTVLFVPATTLVAALAKAHTEGRLEEKLAHFTKPKLLIVDELGYLPFEPDAAHLFFQLVSRRYERGAMLITSNRAVGEWGTVFGDPVVATAILDRMLHHSHVVTIRGESYRLREKRRSGLVQKAAPTPETTTV